MPAHFGLELAARASRARSTWAASRSAGSSSSRRSCSRAAAGDAVAAAIRDRLVDEIVALARATRDAPRARARARRGRRRRRVDARRRLGAARTDRGRAAPRRRRSSSCGGRALPPIVGAALLGLDAVGAGADAQARLRSRAESPRSNDSRSWRSVDGKRALRPGDADLRRHRRAGRRCARPDDRRRRVPRPGRPVRFRQDDRAAHARGARGGRRGRDLHRRPRRHRPAAEAPRRRDGVPELRALPVSHRRRQHRVPAADRARLEGGARAADARGRAAARARAVPRAQAGPALGRPAPARRDGPRDHPAAERVPDGRAAVEPRREAAGADARGDRGAAGAARDDDRLRHARPVGGDDARRPRRRARRRPAAAVRHAARALRAAGEHVRRRLHRLTRR